MKYNVYLAIMTAGLVSFLIRAIPLTLIRKQIKNRFLHSFLYYVPYVTLAAMTFPAIIDATQSQIAGIIALVVGVVAAFFELGLLSVAGITCLVVFISELLLV